MINSHEPFTAFKIRTGYDMTFQQDYLLRQHFACSMFCSSGFMQHTNKRNQITKHELKIRKAFSMGEKLFLKNLTYEIKRKLADGNFSIKFLESG